MVVTVREVDSYWPSPDHLGPVTAEVMVFFLGWLL